MIRRMRYSKNDLCKSCLDEKESSQYLLCDSSHLLRPHTAIFSYTSHSIFRLSEKYRNDKSSDIFSFNFIGLLLSPDF